MSKLILIRGLPGSGKSTLARKMLSDGVVDEHFEADMWLCLKSAYDGGFFKGFTTVACEYHWSPERVKAAHAACVEATNLALRSGKRWWLVIRLRDYGRCNRISTLPSVSAQMWMLC